MISIRSFQLFSTVAAREARHPLRWNAVLTSAAGHGQGKSWSMPWISSAFSAAALVATTSTTTTLCDTNDSDSNDQDFLSKIKAKLDSTSMQDLTNQENIDALLSTLGTQAQLAIDSGVPTNLSYGFFCGYISGLALKKIGKAASVTLGMGFLALQALAFNGYIDMNHEKISKEVVRVLDRNQDGTVGADDLREVVEQIRKVAEYGLGGEGNLAVSGGGFGMGFYGGLRSG